MWTVKPLHSENSFVSQSILQLVTQSVTQSVGDGRNSFPTRLRPARLLRRSARRASSRAGRGPQNTYIHRARGDFGGSLETVVCLLSQSLLLLSQLFLMVVVSTFSKYNTSPNEPRLGRSHASLIYPQLYKIRSQSNIRLELHSARSPQLSHS